MAKRLLMMGLILGSFAAVAPAAVVYGGVGYGGVRVGAYGGRYYHAPRVYVAPYVDPYVAPAYPVYADPYYGYGYGYGYGYAPRYYGGYYRGGGGYYLYIEIADEAQVSTDIEAQYALLTDLGKDTPQSPNPGSGTNDNIKLAKEYEMQRHDIPNGLLRGIHRPIPTVTRSGHAVYGRDDMPNDFAYAVARALDRHQDLLEWSHLNLSYNPRTVTRAIGVPLHPGAARYYRERGYLK